MMKCLSSKVNWMFGWANNPSLEFVVDEIPKRDSLRYHQIMGIDGELFYAQTPEGYVSFFAYNPRNQNGFGGCTFNIILTDGTKRALVGPWSCRAGVFNALGYGPCIDVTLSEEYNYAGHVTVEWATANLPEGIELVATQPYGENDDIIYRPCLAGMTPEASKESLMTADPRWLSSTVLDIARTIKEEKVYERLPILGDALMDAGCDNPHWIEACQKGCSFNWIIGAILENS